MLCTVKIKFYKLKSYSTVFSDSIKLYKNYVIKNCFDPNFESFNQRVYKKLQLVMFYSHPHWPNILLSRRTQVSAFKKTTLCLEILDKTTYFVFVHKLTKL